MRGGGDSVSLMLRSPPKVGVSKHGAADSSRPPSSFETRPFGPLLRMRAFETRPFGPLLRMRAFETRPAMVSWLALVLRNEP
jgi:hypothetical protein